MDKISASHILIMHKESKDSRSELSKKEASDLIKDLHKNLTDKRETSWDYSPST